MPRKFQLTEVIEEEGKETPVYEEENLVEDAVSLNKLTKEATSKRPEKKSPPTPTQEPKEKDTVKEILKEALREQRLEDMKANEINWMDDAYWDSWGKIKEYSKKMWGHKKIDNPKEKTKWFLMAHSKDTIIGKPQLIDRFQKRIPLFRLGIKIEKDKESKTEVNIKSYYSFDERFDKRYGFQKDCFALDFWIYRVEYLGKEYYIYSQKELSAEKCEIKGMLIEVDDLAIISDTLKLPSLSRVFIARTAEPNIKIMNKEELVKFVGKTNLEEWLAHLSQHPFGTVNQFPIEVELLRTAQVLSGKVDGWPLHICYMGPQGTRKTMGHGETLYSKFDELMGMASATSYRLKGLIPSFKKVPAEVGYLVRCDRISILDEVGKLIEQEMNKHDGSNMNILGDFNDILEHKQRSGGSGNENYININPTAKVMIVTNPVSGRNNIASHVGVIDRTTMSRFIWWVQDDKEIAFVKGREGILRNPPHTLPRVPKSSPHTMLRLYTNLKGEEKEKENIVLGKCRGELISKDDFLSIFDSCYRFVSELDDDKVQKLVETTTLLVEQPMRDIWEPRAFHHIKLLVDGLCKTRCLFDDNDPSFKAKQIDYDWTERILIRMIKGWDTDLSIKKRYEGGSYL